MALKLRPRPPTEELPPFDEFIQEQSSHHRERMEAARNRDMIPEKSHVTDDSVVAADRMAYSPCGVEMHENW